MGTASIEAKTVSAAGEINPRSAQPSTTANEAEIQSTNLHGEAERPLILTHMWPVCAKNVIIGEGEEDRTQGSIFSAASKAVTSVRGTSPPNLTPVIGRYEVDTVILNGVAACQPTAVVFRGKLWQDGLEKCVVAGAEFAIFEWVIGRGEALNPPLD